MAEVEVSPSDLRFRFQLNKQLLATITVNNPSAQRVAFKIKTTAPKKYVVRPSSGVAEPRSNVSVQVIMQAQKEYTAEFANCKDKFMVQTTVLSETEQIEKDTFNKDVRKDLKEYRLRVTIEGPAAPPSPVPEVAEGDEDAAAVRTSVAAATTAPAAPAAAAASTAPAPAPEAAPAVDTRLRSTMDNLAAATSENTQLRAQVDRLQRERDELRRQLDNYQLQGGAAKPAAAAVAAPATAAQPPMLMAYVLIAAILAFLLGHYVRF